MGLPWTTSTSAVSYWTFPWSHRSTTTRTRTTNGRSLRVIETSAKDRGDLGVANDAYYRLRVLTSNHYGQPWRALDYVFYRGSPLPRPAATAAARPSRHGRPVRGDSRIPRAAVGRPRAPVQGRALAAVLSGCVDVEPERSCRRVRHPRTRRPRSRERRRALTRAESRDPRYRVLVVCSLLALAKRKPDIARDG